MSDWLIWGILGAGCGIGLLVFLWAFRQKPEPLPKILASLQKNYTGFDQAENIGEVTNALTGIQKLFGSLGLYLTGLASRERVGALEKKLRVLGKSLERHGYEKILGALIGFILPIGLWGALVAIGVSPAIAIFIGIGLLLAGLGFWYPDIPLNEKVEKRRRAFRYAFSSYLDLVTVMLAGGTGIETALTLSAEAGDGWAFEQIRKALLRARLGNKTPWSVFGELGEELGVAELAELAASISLAGQQGARIRDSLSAKADSLRTIQLAEIESEAESRSEKMTIPVLVMVVGLILFIGYGAVQAITTDNIPTIIGIFS